MFECSCEEIKERMVGREIWGACTLVQTLFHSVTVSFPDHQTWNVTFFKKKQQPRNPHIYGLCLREKEKQYKVQIVIEALQQWKWASGLLNVLTLVLQVGSKGCTPKMKTKTSSNRSVIAFISLLYGVRFVGGMIFTQTGLTRCPWGARSGTPRRCISVTIW